MMSHQKEHGKLTGLNEHELDCFLFGGVELFMKSEICESPPLHK